MEKLELLYKEFIELYRFPGRIDRLSTRRVVEKIVVELRLLSSEQQCDFIVNTLEGLTVKTFSGHYRAIVEMMDYLARFADVECLGASLKKIFDRILDPGSKIQIEQIIVCIVDPSWEDGVFSELPCDESVWADDARRRDVDNSS